MKVRTLLEARKPKQDRPQVDDLEMLCVIIQKMISSPAGIWLWLNPYKPPAGQGAYHAKVESAFMRAHDNGMPYTHSLRVTYTDYAGNPSWLELTTNDDELPELILDDGKRVLQEPGGKPFEV